MQCWQTNNALRLFTLELLDFIVDILIFIFYLEKKKKKSSPLFILFHLASDIIVLLDLKDTEASVRETKPVYLPGGEIFMCTSVLVSRSAYCKCL